MLKKILLLITFIVLNANINAEILPPEQAFIPTASIEGNNLIVTFEIKDKYYLYKDKISLKILDNTKIGESIFSKAEMKEDNFFGKIEVYHHNLTITTPIKSSENQINFEVFFQGCWEGGVCYPPISKKLSINIKAIKANSNKKNFFTSLLQQNNINDPASVDIAFKFEVFKVDENNLKAVWDIRKGYYLYNDKFNFKITGGDFGEIKFPQGISKTDEFFGDVTIHKKQLSVDIPIINVSDEIELTTGFQGCWEGGVCYPPVQKITKIILKNPSSATLSKENITSNIIETQNSQPTTLKNPSSATLSKENITSNIIETQNSQPTTENLNEEEMVAKDFLHESFFWILISFFGFGILAAFTSCILPMIPILSAIIIGSGNPTKKKAFIMSLVFVIFMALTYAVVGVLFGLFGSNLQSTFQNPWVLSTFSLMFVALAFSMFGFYEIKIPNFLQAKLTTISNNQKGGHLIGVAIMGVLSALIVGPCAAPVLSGALLYISNSGDAVLGGAALFFMGFGMGLPLIIAGVGVATPRAGVWMDTIKSIFGVIMLGMAIYFLDRILDEHIILILWAVLLTIAPIALGVLGNTSKDKPIQRIFKAVGLIVLGYGILLWILVASGGGDMFAPLKNNTIFGNNISQVQKVEFEKVKTLSNLQQIIKTSKQPIMVDFYADWCIYCKVYDKKVFTDTRVAGILNNMRTIKIDITKNNSTDIEILKFFNISAPPAILFFKNGKEVKSKRVIGEKNAAEFYKILQSL